MSAVPSTPPPPFRCRDSAQPALRPSRPLPTRRVGTDEAERPGKALVRALRDFQLVALSLQFPSFGRRPGV